MDSSIFVAFISVSGSIIVAALTFYKTKKNQLDVELQHEKMNHYKELLSSLSDLAVDGTDKEIANQRFSLAVNTIALVAPQYVITALMNFHDEVKFSNKNRTVDRHDELLKELVLAIRKDIGRSSYGDNENFTFHLIGSSPKYK